MAKMKTEWQKAVEKEASVALTAGFPPERKEMVAAALVETMKEMGCSYGEAYEVLGWLREHLRRKAENLVKAASLHEVDEFPAFPKVS
ncbi:MAG: hypothetical protein IJS96_08900 [Schwartzia sp.]|nr:hypothetical protein [Schwartzia sp. (in: firmicutes)]